LAFRKGQTFIKEIKILCFWDLAMNKTVISGENIPRGDNNEKAQLS
jgi:hypothetical protein